MRIKMLSLICLATTLLSVHAMQYEPAYAKWNLNTNQQATNPLDYSGVWENHTFNPSPNNWRFPFYTLMLDRWVNGDPTNDNANGTVFEQDAYETQLRHGGDIIGLRDSLDYLQGMGVKVSSFTCHEEFMG
jgi:alpha-1,3-glucan synthase